MSFLEKSLADDFSLETINLNKKNAQKAIIEESKISNEEFEAKQKNERIEKIVEKKKTDFIKSNMGLKNKSIEEMNERVKNKLDSSGQFLDVYKWIWSKKDKCFFDTRDATELSNGEFKNEHLDKIITIETGEVDKDGMPRKKVITPDVYARKIMKIEKVDTLRFNPSEKPIFKDGHQICGNTFDFNNLTQASNDKYEEVKKLVLEFADYLFGSREECKQFMLDHGAYLIQNIGKKVDHMPIVYGVHGCGKSTWFRMLRYALGNKNVWMVVKKENMKDGFNDFKFKNLIMDWEEVKTTDHDFMSMLKAEITNDVQSSRGMQKSAISSDAYYNLFGTTNYKDALPLAATERRFSVVFVDPTSETKWQDNDERFIKLNEYIKDYPGTIKQVFLDHVISDNYSPRKALITEDFHEMVAASRNELHDFIEDAIEDRKEHNINDDVICVQDLNRHLASRELNFKSSHIKRVLSEMGFSSYSKRIRLHNNILVNSYYRKIDSDDCRRLTQERFLESFTSIS